MSWTKDEQRRFLEALLVLCETYGRNLSVSTKAFWLKIMQGHLTCDEALRAIEKYLVSPDKNSSFFPKPGDLIREAVGMPDDQVEVAWHDVSNTIERIGPYSSVKFRDPIAMAVIRDMGGWPQLCDRAGKTYDAMTMVGHEFRRLYRHYLRSRQVPEISHLPGIQETENAARGFAEFLPEPIETGRALPSPLEKALRRLGLEGENRTNTSNVKMLVSKIADGA